MRAAGRCGWALVLTGLACTSVPLTATHDGGSGPSPIDGGHVEDAGTARDAGSSTDGGVLACGLTFDNPAGAACNSDGDCSTHHCAFMEGGGLPGVTGPYPGVCTTACSNAGVVDSCVNGYTCNYAYSIELDNPTQPQFGAYCLPTTVSQITSGNYMYPLGSPCWRNSDCAGQGATCESYNYGGLYLYTFCAGACSATDEDCGACGRCGALNPGATPLCIFVGPTPLGGACAVQSDCATFFCDGFCSTPCSATAACPDGSVCHAFTSNGQTQSLCVLPSQLGGTANGGQCTFDDECAASSLCLPGESGLSVCTGLASLGGSCPFGSSQDTQSFCAPGLDCRELAPDYSECSESCGTGCMTGQTCYAPQLDTVLTLYNSATGAIAMNDNIADGSGSLWSEIPATPVAAGTYWVTVSTNYGDYVGNYQLLITDGINTPTVVRELPESPIPNNSFANAQQIPFPATLSGVLQASTEVDYYEFTVPTADTITLETLPGPPSACLPSNQTGSTVLGGACTESFNCVTGLNCVGNVNICSQSCAVDLDCGAGNSCVDLGPGLLTCVSPANIGVIADGAACLFSWQCPTGDLCAANVGGPVCAAPCSLGTSTCDPTTSQCGTTIDQDTGATATACLPLGQFTGTFDTACNVQSDCASGLVCTAGECQQSCTKDSDCPYQSGLSTDPIVCRTCQSDADCTTNTEEGECVATNDINELHCALHCDTAGACPTGFVCQQNYPFSVCVPADGSCHTPYCDLATGSTTGQCAIPPDGFAESCTTSSECSTQSCVSGLCSRSCQTNADCDCPTGDLTCQSGSCQLVKSYTAEVLPNDTMALAQPLTGPLPITLLGTVPASAGSPGASFYSIPLTAGTTVNFDLRPICNVADTSAYLIEVLFDPTEGYVGQSENAGYGTYDGYSVTTTGNYILQVEDVNGSVPRSLNYVLSVTSG